MASAARPLSPDGINAPTTSAGGVPIYRAGAATQGTLVGALGISGDGVDEVDELAWMALDRAAAILAEQP
jgi:uncharacterized protein GlcG (DUF336 family)